VLNLMGNPCIRKIENYRRNMIVSCVSFLKYAISFELLEIKCLVLDSSYIFYNFYVDFYTETFDVFG